MLLLFLLACFDPRGGPQAPGVLLVTVDTWRADHLNATTSPNAWALAQRGRRFANAWSPIGLTTAAHATILTGLRPPDHGLRGNNHHGYRLGPEPPTLPERFAAAGWDTAAFVSSWPALGDSGLGRGFAVADGPPAGERPSADTLAAAQAWLAERPGPWMLWVHLNDPHGPYTPAPEDLAAVGGGQDDAARYAGEVHQADRLLGPLLAEAEARGAWVLLTADHGEVLTEERCGWQHERSSSPVVLRVPLVLAGPGLDPGVEQELQAGLTDVFPTLLALAGLPDPGGHAGLDLRTARVEDRAAWVAESGLCDPECAAGCAPTGFLGKDRVVFGRDGGVYRARPGAPPTGDPTLAEALSGYPAPAAEPAGGDGERVRGLGYVE